jgi:hypothetical protein
MGHPDFRAGKKVFATLSYPSEGWAMVKLTPEQQEALTTEQPAMFAPVSGGWGLRGATHVILRAARAVQVRLALAAAWQNVTQGAPEKRRPRRRK